MSDVVFDVDGRQASLSESEATLLAENLHNFSAGKFPYDVATLESIGVERGWLDGADAAARVIEDVLTDKRSEPIPLAPHGKATDAIDAALRLIGPTSFDATSGSAKLFAFLNDSRSNA
jgi:hypothetical protein